MTPVLDMEATGENIQNLMAKNGIKVKDVQRACGFSVPQGVYKWIHGDHMPSIDNLVILSHLLGVTIDDILVIKEI